MSNDSTNCQDESNSINCLGKRVFPCLYHCKRMLCIEHLAEHERSLEKNFQVQYQLRHIWESYANNFNELELLKQYTALRTKLFNFQSLKQVVQKLLSINYHEESNIDTRIFQRAIDMINFASESENISTITSEEINDNNQNNETIPRSASIDSRQEAENIDSRLLTSTPNVHLPNPEPNINGGKNRPSLEKHFSGIDEEDSVEFDEDERMIHQNQDEIDSTAKRNSRVSRLRAFCPLTEDGAFGINSHHHGIRLCSNKTNGNRRSYGLNQHFRRFHMLTPLAALKLVRAVASGQDPKTDKLFSHDDVILNVNALRPMNCPINKPFNFHQSLNIPEFPCFRSVQERQLKDHLQRKHGFSSQAACVILKTLEQNRPVHMIEFPSWISILR